MTENRIRPKLVLDDAAAALAWYREHLDATIGEVVEADGTVVHADLTVLGTHLSVKDGDTTDPSPASAGAPGQILEVVVDDPDPIGAAMAAGGAATVFEIADQEYGARAGRLRDPFGVQWLLTTPVT